MHDRPLFHLDDGFREGLRSAEVRKGGFQHASDLGVLYHWLSASRASRELRPIQQLVRNFIVENYLLDPGRAILGHAIHAPQLLSLEHVRQRLEMRPERVVRLLRQAGLHDGDLSRGISVEKVSQLEAYIQKFVTTTAAASIIGCHPGQLAQLQNARLLVPREMEEGVHRLHRDDLDALVRPIADLPEVTKAGAFRTLWKTYNYVKCSIADICRLLLDGQLESACRLSGPPSLSAVLVDPEEVRRHLIMEAPEDASAKDTAKRLRTNQQTLHYLASQGLLKLNRRRHPVTRSIRWYVERCSLEQFEKRFVTVGVLAIELGERPGPLAKRLEALGIRPIFSVPDVSRIYERTALVEVTINGRAEEVPLAEAH